MKVFLADIYITGHHLSYIRLFAEIFQRLNYEVIILLPECSKSEKEKIDSLLSGFSTKILFFSIPMMPTGNGRLKGRDYLLKKWGAIAQGIKNSGVRLQDISLVYFPYMDAFLGPYLSLKQLDSTFIYPWAGLIMNPQNCRVKMSVGWLRKGILDPNYLLSSKNCKAIFVFDQSCALTLQKKFKKRVDVVPDVIDDAEPDHNYWLCREIDHKRGERNVVSLLGSLSKRKGLLTLLQALDLLNNKLHIFVIAGKLDINSFDASELEYIEDTINRHRDTVIYYPERIPDEASFNALVDKSDVIYASYLDFAASSNLISKAAKFKKPVLVSAGFFMEEVVEQYRLGFSIQQADTTVMIEKLNYMASEDFKSYFKESNRIDEFNKEHSKEFLMEKLQAFTTQDLILN